MEMHSITRLTSPGRLLGNDYPNNKTINHGAGAPKPQVPKTLIGGDHQLSNKNRTCLDTSVCNKPHLTSFSKDEMAVPSNIDSFSHWPTILRGAEIGIYGVITRDGAECIGPMDPEERSDKRDRKAPPATECLELHNHDNSWSTGQKQFGEQALSTASKLHHINDMAESVPELELHSDDEVDDYAISGIDDLAAAKRREITYRADFTRPLERCGSSCCGYSDVSCSDCSSEASGEESFEVGEESGEDRYVDTKLAV